MGSAPSSAPACWRFRAAVTTGAAAFRCQSPNIRMSPSRFSPLRFGTAVCHVRRSMSIASPGCAVNRSSSGCASGCVSDGPSREWCVFGTTAVQFWFTGFFQKLLPGNEIGAAFLGGVFSGIPCSLWELTMIQQQRFGGTVWGTPLGLVRQHGPLALARGLTMTMGRESLYTMAMLGVTPALKRYIADNYQLEGNTALAIGALSGSFFSATITHPMDTIKTCMQGDVGREKYTNVPQTGRLLAQEYGVAQGLFKGLSWRIGLIATTFFLVNKFKEVLAPMVFPEDDDDGGAPPS